MKGIGDQLTLRGLCIGCAGCAIITASSAYMALKMGALPWPIVFAAVVSLFFLKAVSKGSSTLNEANVTHTVMSAGAMVAGGLAFTVPGAWMLGMVDEISFAQMLVIALSGVALGLVCTALLRRHFVDDAGLEFPVGQAAAKTLVAGESGGAMGRKLFGSMGLASVFTLLRDGFGVIPSMVATLPIPGVSFGVYVSPMMLAIGFLVGTGAVVAWFVGAVLGNFGIVVVGSAAGLWDVATGRSIVASLGMGVMMGCGFAVVVKDVIPKGFSLLKARMSSSGTLGSASDENAVPVAASFEEQPVRSARVTAGLAGCVTASVAVAAAMGLGLSPLASVMLVLLTFVATAMSAQSVGQTGIDPMEIFGLIALLVIAAFADVAQVQLFFIAAVVAVACGLAGDVMNDFKAGRMLGTDPRAQIAGQAVGGVLGAFVSVAVMAVLLEAYGAEAFGAGGSFVAAQASVVATMVSGAPHAPAFVAGLVVGFILYCAGLPSMMIGLGIYLPFYMSLTAFLGCAAKMIYDYAGKRQLVGLSEEVCNARIAARQESGLVVASGFLGGESIIGILLALVVTVGGLTA